MCLLLGLARLRLEVLETAKFAGGGCVFLMGIHTHEM